jgi:arylsulfatase A-like enzyme/Tfp pilus assembly protein PilF
MTRTSIRPGWAKKLFRSYPKAGDERAERTGSRGKLPAMRPRRAALLLVAAGTLVACGDRGVPPAYPRASLDLVLVTLDTVRADRLPAYGYAGIATPALDALGREGVRFANAATTVPFTLPAHSSILTGLYPPRHGVRENVGYVLPETVPTLAERLGEAGYATAGFVSAFVLDGRWGIGRGFETYLDDFDPEALEGANLASAQRDGAETTAAAIAWLDERPADRPFFLWLHLYEAHDPYTPPEPFASRYPGRPYEAEIAYVDELVGRLTTALATRGLASTTAVVVTGDHGEGLGDHDEQFHGFFVYDTTVRVPLLLRLPGGELAGRVVETAVSHVDLVPTFLELAGLAPAPDLDGTSLLELAAADADPTRAVYSESLYPLLHYGWAPLRALRRSDRKYIAAPLPELYQASADPGESRNEIRTERAEATRLARELEDLRARLDAAAPTAPGPADLDEEALARLAALGYVAGQGGVPIREETAVPRADPKDKIALHHAIMAAQSALGAGETDAARGHLERVLAQDPGILDAHQMLGSLAAQEERWDEALAAFQSALALDPEHKASLFGLANAYRKLGRSEEALVGFERLLALSPRDSKAALAAADLLAARGERTRAIAVLERAATGRDAPPILANQLGELLVAEGRTDEARAAFERALAAQEDLAQPHFNLAVLSEEAGDLDGAIAHYERASALAPRHYQALFNLGRLVGERGEVDRQQQLWEAAIESNPEFVRGYYYLAKLLMDRGGDLTRAEELARAGLARDPAHVAGPLGYYLLADLLNRTGRAAEAQDAARQGRELEPGGRGR